ncbi:MAG: beta strand repeat-containing protein [Pirellulales bacterium]
MPGAQNLISGNSSYGVSISGASATGNLVAGNLIGTDVSGTIALGNSSHGVLIRGGSSNNIIGGSTAANRNIISGNDGDGVKITGGSGNTIQGNFIGTDVTGTADLGNSNDGVSILDATLNTIGGTTVAERNIISGNDGDGVDISGNTHLGSTVSWWKADGNAFDFVGTNNGTLQNGASFAPGLTNKQAFRFDGTDDFVEIPDSASLSMTGELTIDAWINPNDITNGTIVSKDDAGLNEIGYSFGFEYGKLVFSVTVGGNTQSVSLLGLFFNTGTWQHVAVTFDTLGTMGMFLDGVRQPPFLTRLPHTGIQEKSEPVLIGARRDPLGALELPYDGLIDEVAIYDRVLTAPEIQAIFQSGGPAKGGNYVQGNRIGTDATGNIDLGNALNGVLIDAGAADTTIGGTAVGAGNVIAFNRGVGVRLSSAAGTGNAIRGNSIFDNVALGIDLVGGSEDAFGVTANDPLDVDGSPNNFQNFPVLTEAFAGAVTHVVGTLNSTPNTPFELDFFASRSADPSGFGEGQGYLGSAVVTTDASGDAAFVETFSAVTVDGDFITATATDPSGNTSEFSAALVARLNLPPTIDPANVVVTLLQPSEEVAEGFGFPTTSILENDTIRLDGLFENADQDDVHTVVIQWGDGRTSTIPGIPPGARGFSAEHKYDDENPSVTPSDIYTIEVTVTDDDGGSGRASIDLTVSNVAPKFDGPLSLDLPVIDEADSVTLSGQFIDPGMLDIHSVIVDWGDGTTPQTFGLPAGDRNFDFAHQYKDDSGAGLFAIDVTVKDDDSGQVAASTTVGVSNVPPTVSILAAPATGSEGSPIHLNSQVTDPGLPDPPDFAWNVTKDGSPFASGTASQFTFTPDDEGSYVVRLTVIDDEGGVGTASPATIVVGNVPPIINDGDLTNKDHTGAVVSSISEGDTITLAGIFADPGGLDTHTIEVDWGDRSAVDRFNLDAGVLSFDNVTHTYVDDNPSGTASDDYTITVTVEDDSTDSDSANTDVTIFNADPTVRILDNGSNSTTVRLTSAVSDPGSPSDTFTYAWSADPSGTIPSGTPTDQPSISFPKPTGGIVNVTLAVTDDDGGSDAATTLFIGATNNSDTITIVPSIITLGNVKVTVTTIGGPTTTGDFDPGDQIVVEAGGNDDTLTVDASITTPIFVDGGAGDDDLTTGSGDDVLDGGTGDDVLRGGAGDDTYLFSAFSNKTAIEPVDGGNDTLDFSALDTTTIGGITLDMGLEGTAQELFSNPADGTLTLQGKFENTTGSADNDAIAGNAENNLIFGGPGDDSIQGIGGSDTIVGGVGDDMIIGGGGGDESIDGGSGADTITSGGGPGDTIFGGPGDDSIQGTGGSDTIVGGDGNDMISGGGDGMESIDGGAGNDTITSGGGPGDTIFGGPGDDSIQGTGGGDTIVGGDGNDTIIGGGGGGESIDGGSGDDTITSGGGTGDTIFGGPGNDLIILETGSVKVFGDDDVTNDPISHDRVLIDTDADIRIVTGAPSNQATVTVNDVAVADLTDVDAALLVGGESDNVLDASLFNGDAGLVGAAGDDTLLGGSGNDTLVGGTGDDSLVGGGGEDTYVFGSDGEGNDEIVELPENSGDTLNFTAFPAAVTVDLSFNGKQTIDSAGKLSLTFSNIENAFGSQFDDTLTGDAQANQLFGFGGIDSLVGGAGDDVLEAHSTRVAYLDFDSATDPGEHVYTPAERDAIESRMERDFAAFNVQITQTQPASDPFITVLVNEALTIGGVPSPGGASQRVGWRGLARGGTVIVDVNAFLGTDGNQLPPTEENFIALSSTIAIHELAHMYGLRHHDAFGAPGTGIFAGLGGENFLPGYPGPIGAGETANHLIASPASVRTSLVDALGNPFFGEREALKLAFGEHGRTVFEDDALKTDVINIGTGTFAVQPLGPLPPLAVPNTLVAGANVTSGPAIKAGAASVAGSIVLVGPPGSETSESDFYSFQAQTGDVVTVELMSFVLRHRIADPIDSLVRVYDASGVKLGYPHLRG